MAQYIELKIVSSKDGKVKISELNFAEIYNVICDDQQHKLARIDPYKDTFFGFHDTLDLIEEIKLLEKKYTKIKKLLSNLQSFFEELKPGEILCFLGD